MRNINKCLLLSIVILLVSGCSVKYNIDIKKDLRIEENISFVEKNDTILTYSPDIDNYIVRTKFNLKVDNLYNANYYYLEDLKTSKNTTVKATRVYDDFSKFQDKNILKSYIFESMVMNTDGSLIEIKMTSIKTPYEVFIDNEESGSIVDDATIKIKVPYEVIANNADSVDELNNIYTWKYDDLTLYKDIEIKFNKDKIFKADIIKQLMNNFENNKGKFITVFILIIVIIVIAIITLKNKKNNKL